MAIPLSPLAPLTPAAFRLAPLMPVGGAPLGPQPQRRRRRKKQPALTREEEESILGGVMGTVQYLGETLDKPGRAVRGLLAGRPEAAMNLIPFSDTFGLTDPKKATSGRDLLRMYAGAPKNKPGLFHSPEDAFWDVAGFATEVGLDPLTFVTGPLGTLTKKGAAKVAGTGAKKLATKGDDILKMVKEVVEGVPAKGSQTLGRTPAAIAKQIEEGDRALLGLKVPFGPQFGPQFGTKSKLAAKAMDYLFYRGKYSPIPVARGLFSSTAGGQFTGAASRAADILADTKRQAVDQFMNVMPAMDKGMKDIEKQFFDMAKVAGDQADMDTFNEFTLRMLETKRGLPSAEEMAIGLRRHMMSESPAAAIKGTEELAGELHKHLDAMIQLKNDAHGRIRELGGNLGVLQDTYVPHFPRRPGDPRILDPDVAKRPGGYYDFEQSRKDYLRNWPGGSVGIHAVAKDKLITAARATKESFEEAMQHVAETEGRVHASVEDMLTGGAAADALAGEGLTGTLRKIMGKHRPGKKGYTEARKKAYQAFRKGYDDDLKASLLENLRVMGVDVGEKASLRDVHKAYLWSKHARKPFDEAANAGLLDELGLRAEAQRIKDVAKAVGTKESQKAAKEEAELLLSLGVDDGLGRAQYREAGRQAEMQRFFDDGALDRMLDHFRKYPKEVQQKGLFDRRPVEDLFDYYRSMLEKEATLKTAHNYLGGTKEAQIVLRGGEAGAEDGVSLVKAWEDAGFKKRGLEKFVRDNSEQFGDVADDTLDDFINDLTIRKGGESILRNLNESMKPKVQKAYGEFLDKMNATWKGNMTIPFPSFHARNSLSSVWSNWASGELPLLGKDGLLMETARAWKFALSGKGEYEYLDEMTQIGLFRGHVTRQAEVAGNVADIAGDARTQALGTGFVQGVRDAPYSELLDPRASRGGFAGEARNVVQRAGEKLYAVVEFAARATPYTMFRKQGLTPAQAYRKVMRMQFDYSELAPFEREVMTKIIPFYTWSRKSIPYTLTKLLERPGGKTAQTIRTLSIQPEEGEYRPSWLREGAALQVPGGVPPFTSYLKQGGIPVEDLNLLAWDDGLPDIGRTARKALGMTRQGIQAPLEWVSGESLFSGRKLKDARSTIGALARPFGGDVERSVADEILARSPFSRVGTELSKLADWQGFRGGRKPAIQVGAKLLSGLNFTSVDTELQRQRDLKAALREDILADPFAREGSHFYTPRRFRGTEDAETAEELIRRERQAGEILKILQDDRDAKKKAKKK